MSYNLFKLIFVLILFSILFVSCSTKSIYNLNKTICDNKAPKLCKKIGDEYFYGIYETGYAMRGKSGHTINYDWAREFYKKSCDGGYAEGCAALASTYTDSKTDEKKGVIYSPDLYEKYIKKACDLNDAKSCNNLGVIFYDRGNFSQALKLYEKACGNGSVVACGNAASMYVKSKDYEKAKKVVDKCNNSTKDLSDFFDCRKILDAIKYREQFEYDANKY